MAFFLNKKSSMAALCFFYLAAQSCINSFYPGLLNPTQSENSLYTLKNLSNNSLVFILVIFFLGFSLSKKNVDLLINSLGVLAIACSIHVIAKKFLGLPAHSLMLNTSMEGTFLGIMSVVILFKPIENEHWRSFKWIQSFSVLIILTGTIATTSSVGIGAVALGIITMAFFSKKFKPILLLLSIMFSISAFLFVGEGIFSDSLRVICWNWSMDWWSQSANHLFGTGIGTFWGIGPWIQDTELIKACASGDSKICESAKFLYQEKNYYTFMHSDWLQLLFEGGFVGLILGYGVFITALVKSFNRPWLFASILVFSATATINMPTKYVITSIIGVLLLRMSLLKEENGN